MSHSRISHKPNRPQTQLLTEQLATVYWQTVPVQSAPVHPVNPVRLSRLLDYYNFPVHSRGLVQWWFSHLLWSEEEAVHVGEFYRVVVVE